MKQEVFFKDIGLIDYKIALENGSTLIRIGSAISGKRNYV